MRIPNIKSLLHKLKTIKFSPRRLVAAFLTFSIFLTSTFFITNLQNFSKGEPLETSQTPLPQEEPAQTTGLPAQDKANPPDTSTSDETPDPNTVAPPDGAVIEHNLPKEEAVPEVMYTAHFARNEFICDCTDYCNGFPVEMDAAFMAKLEELRNTLGRPVIVTSGVRCVARNAEVGGIEYSWHLTGHAADIYCPGVPYYEVESVARELGFGVVEYADEQYCHIEYRE